MTDFGPDLGPSASSRTATVETDHGAAIRAEQVAAAVAPDNTESMTTRVTGSSVRTEIARETTGGLQATVDDYVVNLGVATAVLDAIERSNGNDIDDIDNADDIGDIDDIDDTGTRSTDRKPNTDTTHQ